MITKKEALSILRPINNTDDALKQAYRQAALKFHPDHGGDENIMKVVNAAYELLKKEFWTPYEQRAANKETPLTEELKKRWDKIKYFEGIKGEIVGSWLWVSGNTRRYKEQLKELNFKWSRNKVAWYWHANKGYRKRTGKKFSMTDIRTKYGSRRLDNEKSKIIA